MNSDPCTEYRYTPPNLMSIQYDQVTHLQRDLAQARADVDFYRTTLLDTDKERAQLAHALTAQRIANRALIERNAWLEHRVVELEIEGVA